MKDLKCDLNSQAQKQKRGWLIVTQTPGSTYIQSDEELEKSGTTVVKHACDLIKFITEVELCRATELVLNLSAPRVFAERQVGDYEAPP